MGKKRQWFGAIKRAFCTESKEKKNKTSMKWGLGKSKHSNARLYETPQNAAPELAPFHRQPVPLTVQPEGIKLAEAEQKRVTHVYTVAIASAAAAEAAVAAAKAAAEFVRLANSKHSIGKSKEEVAAIKIQTAFRGFLARRALRALRGLVRLKNHTNGNDVKRQATAMLRCVQTLARVQSHIQSRRIKTLEHNRALHRQLLLKCKMETKNLHMSEEWEDSMLSKEEIEANLANRLEASMRREKALAYAFSHQWKCASRLMNPTFLDPKNPYWGWSWLERWMAASPWESRGTTMGKERSGDRASVASTTGESMGSDVFPWSSKIKSAGLRNGWCPSDDDTKSMASMQSERRRRHSIAGSSVQDDESLASSLAIPGYMATTESACARNRFHSPLTDGKVKAAACGKQSANLVKKRLSFTASPAAARQHSGGPHKVDVSAS